MRKLFILLFIVVLSCQPTKEGTDLGDLKAEVMAIHDEVMPKIGELRRARKDLMLQADSIVESDSSRAFMLNEIAVEIESANESMMEWMRAFEPEFEGTDEEIETYLEEQKKSIQKVKDDMEDALKKGMDALTAEE